MDWLRTQVRKGLNPRTYVLVGLLMLTLLWIQSLDAKSRLLRAKAASGSAAIAGPLPAVLASGGRKTAPSDPTPAGWGRDPFGGRFTDGGRGVAARPSQQAADPLRSSPPLHLQGIMAGPRGRTALIDGEVVREGGRIGSREVLQIGARSVLLLDQGQVTTLTLKGDGS